MNSSFPFNSILRSTEVWDEKLFSLLVRDKRKIFLSSFPLFLVLSVEEKKLFSLFSFLYFDVAWCGRANNLRQDVVGPQAQSTEQRQEISLSNLYIIHFVSLVMSSHSTKPVFGGWKKDLSYHFHKFYGWLFNLPTRVVRGYGRVWKRKKFSRSFT